MPRGVASKDGDTNVSKNGYHYTRVGGRYRLTHHIVAEEKLGRPIAPDETVSFDDGDRTNLAPSNIKVTKRKTSLKGQLAVVEAKLMELKGERDRLVALIAKQENRGKA